MPCSVVGLTAVLSEDRERSLLPMVPGKLKEAGFESEDGQSSTVG